MFDYVHNHNTATHVPALCASCAPLLSFAQMNREALLNAAALLGGAGGVRLAHSVLDGLASRSGSRKRLKRELRELRDLLMLEHVHESHRVEAGLFAQINPGDPIVEDICLLADGLEEGIRHWEALHETPGSDRADAQVAA